MKSTEIRPNRSLTPAAAWQEVDAPWMDVLWCIDNPTFPLRTPLTATQIASAMDRAALAKSRKD